ncbi:hypothetical protein PHLGIDRAFT_123019 [Phlebiopsis gigantea 11061_1 CR5-6]|uniref:HMG box domain-containing protein n=1 Tax=Phlebiopsis gigantea (strain 11061_1 CR5-6) TaxID=745531 RepID=A0A0C3PAK5_PHLG1|nr:hypothetical protein PHLGIDRAFT_123019 [Phlebiopsis gigantea 11061_1 CR5-6]
MGKRPSRPSSSSPKKKKMKTAPTQQNAPFTVLRWGDAAEAVLFELYERPDVQTVIALPPGKKRRSQETDDEHRDRLWQRATNPDTKLLAALPNETKEEYDARYDGLYDNITKTRKVQPVAPIPVFRRQRKRTGFDAFRTSDDPLRPDKVYRTLDDGRKIFDIKGWNNAAKEAWNNLSEDAKAEYTAAAMSSANNEPEADEDDDPEAARAQKAAVMHDYITTSAQYWHQETGQVGLILWGGLDEHGKPTAFVEPIGATEDGTTLETRLAKRTGLLEEHVKSILYEFVLDVFHDASQYTPSLARRTSNNRSPPAHLIPVVCILGLLLLLITAGSWLG